VGSEGGCIGGMHNRDSLAGHYLRPGKVVGRVGRKWGASGWSGWGGRSQVHIVLTWFFFF
jgi:hypothetical protein